MCTKQDNKMKKKIAGRNRFQRRDSRSKIVTTKAKTKSRNNNKQQWFTKRQNSQQGLPKSKRIVSLEVEQFTKSNRM